MEVTNELMNKFLAVTNTPVSVLEFLIGLILTSIAAILLQQIYKKYGLSLSDRAFLAKFSFH